MSKRIKLSSATLTRDEEWHAIMVHRRLYVAAKSAVAQWGETAQLRQLTEECGELIAAVNQLERGRITDGDLASEVADVFIMLAQARHILGKKFEAQLDVKLARLEERLAAKEPA